MTPTPPTPPPPQSVEEVKIVAHPVATVAEIPVPIPVKDVEPNAIPVAPVVSTPPAPVVDSPVVDIEIKVCLLFLLTGFQCLTIHLLFGFILKRRRQNRCRSFRNRLLKSLQRSLLLQVNQSL